ncbi:tetratricopeptide repeat protein [Thalassobacillus pellis]|uniref:tetratricopeptide repeat protein n=1 Tax=Thalassobacillus pellis TaxID=748008 RepID=UPI00195FEE80|nr:tetratricopeptide repeat protein [Thalassobacillus pellis]MBM7551370.1 tetratricopeptide (TPR) repeat protein [Thalassobacillus pellis]
MPTSEKAKATQANNKVIPFLPTGEFYFTHGVQAFQKRNFQSAEKWLKKAIDMTPDEPLYSCQLSVVYTEVGSYHKANQLLTEVLSVFGKEYVDCYYLIANNYAHLGLFTDARKYAEAYLEKTEQGDFQEAAEQLLELFTSIEDEEDDDEWMLDDEDELLVYQETALYHLEHKEWDKAIVLLEEMMQLFPHYTAARHEYSFALFKQGDEQEAIELELQWLENEQNNLYSHVNLAIFYKERKEIEKSEAHIEIIRNIYPIHDQQKLFIAQAMTRTGYYHEACERFRSIRSRGVKQAKAFYKWHSIATYHTGNPSKALHLWEQGCRKYPEMSEEGGPWNVS